MLVGEVETGDREVDSCGKFFTFAGPFVGFYKDHGHTEYTAGWASIEEAAMSITLQSRMNMPGMMGRKPW